MTVLISRVISFMDTYWDPGRPLLLGLSGGPDSLALLYLLIEYGKRRRRSLRLHLAHIDHGWRTESREEAVQLALLAERLGLPFHMRRLQEEDRQGNLEASGREARLRFFREICQEHHCQAVLLGHQANDVAETTLKYLFEGASLPQLAGLRPVVKMSSLEIWRPLLDISKENILEWLAQKKLDHFEDSTNWDTRFLRGRMRSQILPTLTEQFGKEVTAGLLRLANESGELQQYLDGRVAPHLNHLQIGPLGLCLDVNSLQAITPYELRYLIRMIVVSEGFLLSRDQLELIVHHLIKNSADKQIDRRCIVDRKRLFVLRRVLETPDTRMTLCVGDQRWGPWLVSVKSISDRGNKISSWEQLWKGEGCLYLPSGTYAIGPPEPQARIRLKERETTLKRVWSNLKVPAFLRRQVPVIWSNNRICGEFLSGRPSLFGNQLEVTIHVGESTDF